MQKKSLKKEQLAEFLDFFVGMMLIMKQMGKNLGHGECQKTYLALVLMVIF